MEEKIGPYGLDQFSIILFFVVCLQFSDSIFSDGGKDRSVWLGSVHDISYLRGLRSLSCPRHYQPRDNWILYQSKSATFLLSLAPTKKVSQFDKHLNLNNSSGWDRFALLQFGRGTFWSMVQNWYKTHGTPFRLWCKTGIYPHGP